MNARLAICFVCAAGGVACAGDAPLEKPPAEPARKEPSTAAEVFEANLEKRGGRGAHEALRVVERAGTMEVLAVRPPAKGSYRTCVDYERAVVVSVEAGPVSVHQVLRGGAAWRCDAAFEKCEPASPEETSELVATAREANREEIYDWARAMEPGHGTPHMEKRADGFLVQLYGEEQTDYVFTSTFELVEKRRGEKTRTYGDWRTVNGVAFPFRITDADKGVSMVRIQLDEVEVRDEPSSWCAEKLEAPSRQQQPVGATAIVGTLGITKGHQPTVGSRLMGKTLAEEFLGEAWDANRGRRVRVVGRLREHKCEPHAQCMLGGEIPMIVDVTSVEPCADGKPWSGATLPAIHCPITDADREACKQSCRAMSDDCDRHAKDDRGALRKCGCAKMSCESECETSGVVPDFRCR